jgi:tRNA U38,U39,U40 pseudouridine synthase TruA
MQVLGMRMVENVEPHDVAHRLNARLAVTPLGRAVNLGGPLGITTEPAQATLEAKGESSSMAGSHLGIAVSCEAPRKFHPQWRSQLKEYRYRILLADDPAWAPFAWRTEVDPLRAAQYLRLAEGTRDFCAFHDKSSTQKPRTLTSTEAVELLPHLWEFRLRGPGFARDMVRYLVGAAVSLALQQMQPDDYLRALNDAVPLHGLKAPAHGLILWRVTYPEGMDPFGDLPISLPFGPPFF